MTLPTSGTLTALAVGTEFGLSPPFQGTDLYRGGAHVPSGTAAGIGSYQTAPMTPNAGPIQIPMSGTLELSHFYGTSASGGGGTGVSSGALSANNVGSVSPATATCIAGLLYDGRTFTQDGSGIIYHANWYTPTSPGGIIQNFWFRTTVTSGALTSGGAGVGTWQQPSPGTDWDVGATAHTSSTFASDIQSAFGRIDISLTNGGAIIGTWNFSLSSRIDLGA